MDALKVICKRIVGFILGVILLPFRLIYDIFSAIHRTYAMNLTRMLREEQNINNSISEIAWSVINPFKILQLAIDISFNIISDLLFFIPGCTFYACDTIATTYNEFKSRNARAEMSDDYVRKVESKGRDVKLKDDAKARTYTDSPQVSGYKVHNQQRQIVDYNNKYDSIRSIDKERSCGSPNL